MTRPGRENHRVRRCGEILHEDSAIASSAQNYQSSCIYLLNGVVLQLRVTSRGCTDIPDHRRHTLKKTQSFLFRRTEELRSY
ncbi:MAG: hypothetical protein MK110_06920 [Fuerstiella sp.]|nr:hypothetical protein [Fuerstiella sp.]